ncbi:23S rRNA (guanosine(2251)-2'-O)-methyltransferase RlmB [bacterium]|nr:23S rRNA (guanosine(2251)-2'-O)-methyltransferase RlmB [bacterium]
MLLKGKNVSRETIYSGKNIKKIIIKESFSDEVLTYMNKNHIKYVKLPDKDFNNKYHDAQGIVVEIDSYNYDSFDDCLKNTNNDSLCLILDSIEDPQNFGNIIRSFEALGGSFIIIPKNRSIEVTETVMKVSSGAYAHVKITQVTNLNHAIERLKENGYWVMGTDMKGTTSYDEVRVDMPIALIIGSEGFGMSKLVKENCDFLLKIPMVGKINSLNASISAAIVISNIQSRRKKL